MDKRDAETLQLPHPPLSFIDSLESSEAMCPNLTTGLNHALRQVKVFPGCVWTKTCGPPDGIPIFRWWRREISSAEMRAT